MEKHITAVGALRIGWGICGILLAAIVLFFTVGVGLLAYELDGEEEALAILSAIGMPVALVILVFSGASIIGGIGILRRRNWARYLTMVLSVMDLFHIPHGTALGIYCIWALVQDETTRLFAAPQRPQADLET